MKFYFYIVVLLSAMTVDAQTADDIIQQYSKAMGGLENFNAIKTAKFTGVVISQGNSLPLTLRLINGKAMRMDLEFTGQSIINVYNNGKGWKVNPFAGAPVPKDVTGSELSGFKAQASLANNLADYKSRGFSAELAAPDSVNGKRVQVIRLVNKEDGKITLYYIDPVTSLVTKSVTKRDINGVQYDAETVYSNIKIIDGLTFYMNIKVTVAGKPFQEIKYDKVELNVPVGTDIFNQ